MTFIITSRTRRQPTGAVRLRENYYLRKNLKALWLPHWAVPRSLVELVSGETASIGKADPGAGTIRQVRSPDGMSYGLDLTATANYVDGGARVVNLVATQFNISVMALIVPAVLTRGDIITRWTTGSGTADQFDLLYGLTSGKPQFYTGTGSGTDNSGIGSTVMSVGKQYMLGGSSYLNTQRNVYLNGVLEAQQVIAGLINATPGSNYRIGDNSNNDGNFNGHFFFGAVWDITLAPEMFREVYINPYQLVEPIVPRLYFLPVAVVNTVLRSRALNQAVNRASTY